MPNWCSNTLIVKGPGAAQFVQDCIAAPAVYPKEVENLTVKEKMEYESPRFSFNALVPVPDYVLEGGYSNSSSLAMSGYDWSIKFWGVKWDASDVEVTIDSDDYASVLFETPWGPPDMWFKYATSNYPHLHIELDYEEPGVLAAGRLIYKDGELSHEDDSSNRFGDLEDED